TVVPVGVHRWRVVATDRLGQSTASRTRILRVDWKAPSLKVKLTRRGGLLRVAATTSDATGTSAKAAGLAGVTIDFGDGARVAGRKASHRYRRKGAVMLRVTSTGKAGNAAVYKRRLHIG